VDPDASPKGTLNGTAAHGERSCTDTGNPIAAVKDWINHLPQQVGTCNAVTNASVARYGDCYWMHCHVGACVAVLGMNPIASRQERSRLIAISTQ
jgi:hypothetical protein